MNRHKSGSGPLRSGRVVMRSNGSPRRWGRRVRYSDESEAREHLIAAAEQCFCRQGVAKTTIEDIASEAQVGRGTVYRYFEGRDALLVAVLMKQSQRLYDELGEVMQRQRSFGDMLVEVIIETLAEHRSNPVLQRMLGSEAGLTAFDTKLHSEVYLGSAESFLRPHYEAAVQRGEIPEGITLIDVVEWTLRIFVSFFTIGGLRGSDPTDERRMLRQLMAPAFTAPSAVRSP